MTGGIDITKKQPEPRRVDGAVDHLDRKHFVALLAIKDAADEAIGTVEGVKSAVAGRPLAPGAPTSQRSVPRQQGPVAVPRPDKASSTKPATYASPPAQRGPWRHRFEGAAMMAALTLVAFAVGWLNGSLTAPRAAASNDAAAEALGRAGADADRHFASADAALVAAIAAANPPYLVRLHVAEGAAPRDVARLVTALTAWGFKPPQRIAAAEPVSMPEVRFHDAADREAARVLGAVAGRLLGTAALTPPAPQRGAGLDDALASLAGPADAASATFANAAPAAAGPAAPSPRVLDLFVPAQ